MKKLFAFLSLSIPLALFSEAPPPGDAVYPLSEVRPGLVARGYSVFKGSEITSFDAEVIDVQQLGVMKEPMILCRLKGEFFEKNGVIAAMSGSPLYVDGKFLGAVAMGWAFSKEPICGATPAESMTRLYAEKTRGGSQSRLPAGGKSADFQAFIESAAARSVSPEGLPDLLKAEGFSLSYGSGSEREEGAPGELSPGDMIGVQLIQGDIELTAFGTVSSVRGGELLAFGHSFFGLGETDFPVARARVSTVLPSMLFSFKISGSGAEVGRMVYDSPFGVVIEKGKKAATIPVEITYRKSDGSTEKKSVRIITHPYLSRMLLEMVVNLVHEQLEGSGQEIVLALDSLEFDFERGESVVVPPQRFGGVSPSGNLASFVTGAYALLAGNNFKKEKVSAVKIGISCSRGREEGTLLELKALSKSVRKGRPVELEAVFLPFEGDKVVRRISLPTEGLPAGEVKIVAGDNLSVYQRIAGSMAELPRDFQTLKSSLNAMPKGGRIYYAALADRETAYYDGRRIPDLPPSLQALLPAASASSAGKSPEKTLIGPLEGPETGYFDGLIEIKVNVREKGSE